jgi:ADP-heptose:LPS heptosyltransferase
MGDILQTVPFLARLRARYPQAKICLGTDRIGLEVLASSEFHDEVFPLDLSQFQKWVTQDEVAAFRNISQIIKTLRQKHFDLVFNINFSRITLLLTYLLQAPRTIGYCPSSDGRDYFRDPWLAYIFSLVHARRFNRINLVDVFRMLVPLPVDGNSFESVFFTEKRKPKTEKLFPSVIAMQLGSRHSRRRWPVHYYAEVAGRLIQEYGTRIMLLGLPEEAHLGEAFLAALRPAQREQVINLQGRTSLGELSDRLQQANLLITGDTGTMHLATALGTRVLALFLGPALCFETGPYGVGHYVLQAEPDCSPCTEFKATCHQVECTRMISPAMALQVITGQIFSPAPQLLESASFPGVQFYRSSFDSLGINYQPQILRPWNFTTLIAQAYREAGKRLVGLAPIELPVHGRGIMPSGARSDSLKHHLEVFLQALRNQNYCPSKANGCGEALLPLAAFAKELTRRKTLLTRRMHPPDDGSERHSRLINDCLQQGIEKWLNQAG